MRLLRPTTWPEIFAKWREREASNSGWVECATKIKGWPDWESWRRFTADQINATKRTWQFYQFDNPMEEVPNMLLGPYSSWQDGLVNKNDTTFEELLEIPEQYDRFSKHLGVLSIMKALLFKTELIGLIRKDNNKLVCIEGHHRATAISLAKKNGNKIGFFEISISISLAEINLDECMLFDEMLKRGTAIN
ncbi:MAG: hypothetical protein UT32_C0001G0008 [Parcubacteria group bacterium GW2011_GWC2_39_14]|nr:MAG: hypothetical protein UT32_C0001G0008 [Parcubacteria group bacterium GW2011_GWC2_39_14]KKR55432.1 MAG: hypothetical protein UT91_C0001G0007 [Parcubacteria group bacterium GW2011_GWA2_40_23]